MFENFRIFFKSFFTNYQRDRLDGDLESFNEEISLMADKFPNPEIKNKIEILLVKSREAKNNLLFDKAWKYLNKARSMRVLFYKLPDHKQYLVNEVNSLLKESVKIKEWRCESIKKILLDSNSNIKNEITGWDVFLASILRDGHYDNDGFKFTLRKRQLRNVVIITILITFTIYFLSYMRWLPNEYNNPISLMFIQILGAFGAIFSVAINLTSTNEFKGIKDERLASFIANIRPLIGASAALVIYILIKAKLLSAGIISNEYAIHAIAFFSGFSERFVIKSLENIK